MGTRGWVSYVFHQTNLLATTGAAVRDVITTIKRRYPLVKVIVFPTLVQGVNAGESIVSSIKEANRRDLCDVLIVGRGGGSIEELWAFNEEAVARAIFSSDIPIISAVGQVRPVRPLPSGSPRANPQQNR